MKFTAEDGTQWEISAGWISPNDCKIIRRVPEKSELDKYLENSIWYSHDGLGCRNAFRAGFIYAINKGEEYGKSWKSYQGGTVVEHLKRIAGLKFK